MIEALPVLVDRDIAAKLIEDDERLAAIVIEFLTAVPSPSGGRLAAANLLMMVVLPGLGRWNQPKFSTTAVRAVRVRRSSHGKTAPCDCAGSSLNLRARPPSSVIFVERNEFDLGYPERSIEARLSLDAEGLQRNGVIRPADQHICAPAHAD